MPVPRTIDCVECGSVAHLLGDEPELGWSEGDLLVYRCAECQERFDVFVEPADLDPQDGRGPTT